jgi:hypothetical protein
MADNKKSKKVLASSEAKLKKGDRVRFKFGLETVEGIVVEDRGPIGRGRRRLYGIRFPADRPKGDEGTYIELGDEELVH